MMKTKKICGIITKAFGAKAFLLDNLRYVAEKGGFESTLICEPSDIFSVNDLQSIKYHPIEMKGGNVSPGEVLKCIWKMYKIFKAEKYDIIQYASSNGALYASIAGWVARVPVRIYTQWGISYTDYTGLKKFFYKSMTKITCLFSTHVQPDSFANLEFAVQEGLYLRKKGSVLFNGSATGVDMQKFDRSKSKAWRNEIRARYQIPEDAKLFGFVGRLVPEKGINELFEAFMHIDNSETYLMIVGPDYQIDRLDQNLLEIARKHPRIVFCGNQNNTAPFYAAMDYLVLPSYREGFGAVVLEAAAVGVPTICSDIKGPTEFVKDNKTGILCAPQDTDSLYLSMKKSLEMSEEEYKRIANEAYDTALEKFDAEKFRKHFLKNRLNLLK